MEKLNSKTSKVYKLTFSAETKIDRVKADELLNALCDTANEYGFDLLVEVNED